MVPGSASGELADFLLLVIGLVLGSLERSYDFFNLENSNI
jgi:hypothetical protein